MIRAAFLRRFLVGRAVHARRGAALILVMVLSIAVTTLVITMLGFTRSSVQQEFAQHRTKELHAVLKAGVAAGINEINRWRREGAGYVDPEGNGPGAITGDNLGTGIPVRASNGQLLGMFRCVVERNSVRYGNATPKEILLVSAAYPDFTNPERVLTAEVEIARQKLPFGANPLSIVGQFDVSKKNFNIKNSDIDLIAPNHDVPAVNITDPAVYAEFLKSIGKFDVIEGTDPNNPGTPAYDSTTVTNAEPGVLSGETMIQIRDGMLAYVAAELPTATVIDGGKVPAGTTVDLSGNPDAVFTVGKYTLGQDTKLIGEGTLIVTDDFRIEKNGSLDWKGNIIVADNANSKLTVAKDAGFTSSFLLTDGSLAIISDDADSKIWFMKDANVQIGSPPDGWTFDPDGPGPLPMEVDTLPGRGPANLTILGGSAGNTAQLTFKKDLDFTLYGTVSLMGSKQVNVSFDKDASATVFGSVALVLDGSYDPTTKGKKQQSGLSFVVDTGSVLGIYFDQQVFDASLDLLGEFYDPNQNIIPAKISSYWEPSTAAVLGQQATVMATPFTDWGMP